MLPRLAIVVVVALWPPVLRAADFVDPAPPAVAALDATDAPPPKAQPELTFHKPPRALPAGATTADSPGFLGVNHSPLSPETKLKADLTNLPLVWEFAKGAGYAAPAVAGDRLILFHRVRDQEVVDCLHPETGQRYWTFNYPSQYQDRYGYTNGPRCAPTIDRANSLVFTYGAEGKLHALDLKTGRVLWKRDILAEFKLDPNFFGVGSTPLLENNLLILNAGAKDACVIALAPKTGKIAWASPAPKDWGPSYAAPIPATVQGQRRVFVFAGGESRPAAGGLLCINPVDGAVDFAFPWRGRRYESVNASAPVIADDKVFISECYGKGGTLLQLSVGPDKKVAARQLWETDKLATHFMTALPLAGHLYGCDGHGPNACPLVCLDMASGDEKWRNEPDLTEEVTGRSGQKRTLKLSTDRCHLLHADGKTICLTEWGHLLYLDLSPAGVKVVSRAFPFAAPESWTPPVLSRGLLYLSQNTPDGPNNKPPRLLCFDLRAAE
jgi:outer membrane protein assembly factor BamB